MCAEILIDVQSTIPAHLLNNQAFVHARPAGFFGVGLFLFLYRLASAQYQNRLLAILHPSTPSPHLLMRASGFLRTYQLVSTPACVAHSAPE